MYVYIYMYALLYDDTRAQSAAGTRSKGKLIAENV